MVIKIKGSDFRVHVEPHTINYKIEISRLINSGMMPETRYLHVLHAVCRRLLIFIYYTAKLLLQEGQQGLKIIQRGAYAAYNRVRIRDREEP